MNTQHTWWETVFEGNLELGFNKERVSELDHEEFLYFEKRVNRKFITSMQQERGGYPLNSIMNFHKNR